MTLMILKKKSNRKSSVKILTLMAHLLPLHSRRLLPLLIYNHLPRQDGHLLDHHLPTLTASWTIYRPSSWETSRGSSIPETTWNSKNPRTFTMTFTSRTTTRLTSWPFPRPSSRSATCIRSLRTSTKDTSSCTSRYPPSSPWHNALTLIPPLGPAPPGLFPSSFAQPS